MPACCQMILAYHGVSRSQDEIAALLGHIPGAGAPSHNVVRLSEFDIDVDFWRAGSLADLQEAVQQETGAIAFVRTGELPYWTEDTAHALIIVGLAEGVIYVNDPAFERAPIALPVGDFELAWEAFGAQFALIR